MWLFTVYGFYSVSYQSGKSVVRARLKSHLENLIQRFPKKLKGVEIVKTPNTDYRYRIFVHPKVWERIVSELVKEQSWSNFKNEALVRNGNGDYVRALHEVWGVMNDVQWAKERGKKYGR